MQLSKACCALLLLATFLTGCGSSGVTPPKPVPELVLVTNYDTYTGTPYNVSAFTTNSIDGSLTQVSGSPFSVGNAPNSLAVDPAGKFAYVADLGSFDIPVLSIGSNGVLAPITGSPFPTGNNPQAITMHKSGKFLYVATITVGDPTPGAIWAYSVDANTGAIAPLAESPFPAGSGPNSITTDRSGMFLYVNDLGGNVLGYSIDQSTGVLTQIPGSPFPAGTFPFAVVSNPAADYLYVPNQGDNDISAYSINPSSGALSPVPGSPFAAGSAPLYAAVSPSGGFLYVTNAQSENVSAYTVNSSTGALSEVAGSPFSAGDSPLGISVDTTGAFVYVTDSALDDILAYSIGAGGVLSPVSGSPFGPTGGAPSSVVVVNLNTN